MIEEQVKQGLLAELKKIEDKRKQEELDLIKITEDLAKEKVIDDARLLQQSKDKEVADKKMDEAVKKRALEEIKLIEASKKKKGKPLTQETAITKDGDSNDYLVYMHDVFGNGVRDTEPIKVKRAIDGGNVWLVNKELGFKEPMPENNKDYKTYLLKDINDKIKILETKRSEVLKKEIKDTKLSLRDLEQDLIFYKGYKRSLELEEDGSFLGISMASHGRLPYFRFLRKGNMKLPLFTGIETGLIRVPNEFNIREGSDLLKENEEKNNTDKFLNIAKYTVLILMLVAFIAMVYFTADANSTAKVCTEGMVNISTYFGDVVGNGQINTDLLAQLVNNTVDVNAQVSVVPNVIN